jgi:hypothetical protein
LCFNTIPKIGELGLPFHGIDRQIPSTIEKQLSLGFSMDYVFFMILLCGSVASKAFIEFEIHQPEQRAPLGIAINAYPKYFISTNTVSQAFLDII